MTRTYRLRKLNPTGHITPDGKKWFSYSKDGQECWFTTRNTYTTLRTKKYVPPYIWTGKSWKAFDIFSLWKTKFLEDKKYFEETRYIKVPLKGYKHNGMKLKEAYKESSYRRKIRDLIISEHWEKIPCLRKESIIY